MIRRPLLGTAWVVGVALVGVVGPLASLVGADVTRLEAETISTGGGSSSGGGYSNGAAYYSSSSVNPAVATFDVPAGNTAVLRAYGPGNSERTGQGRTDGGTYSALVYPGGAAVVLVWTSATLAEGSHTFEWKWGGSGWEAMLDYFELETTTVPTTTTTTEPPTTTTTVPPTTTTTVPPTTTTTVPPTTTTTVPDTSCDWEHGGLAEVPPEPCEVPAPLPEWALLAGALVVCAAFASLIGGWGR